MSRRSLKLLALTVAIVALGAWASIARADGPILNLGDLCAGASPHATISANGPVTTATSNGNSYFYSPQGLCYRYVVGVGATPNTPVHGHGRAEHPAGDPGSLRRAQGRRGHLLQGAVPDVVHEDPLRPSAGRVGASTASSRAHCSLVQDSARRRSRATSGRRASAAR